MKNYSTSFDQFRRNLRRELFQKRLQDKDHSEARLYLDAQKLDVQLLNAGYELVYPAEWTRKRDSTHLQADISDLNSKEISMLGLD